jgi:N-carbamoyl-L-amino-acid hydrolase
MPVDARRVVADLRELDRLTGGPDGAGRLCWTEGWEAARAFLRDLLADVDGVAVEVDQAGNLWATLPGDRPGAVAVGSHLDSVPGGGWLDGALGVMAGLEVLRAHAAARPGRAVALVDWADEEGARFGRSLFGSSAVAGTLDADEAQHLRDADGQALPSVLASHGVDLDRALDASARRAGLAAYLELHIEQGPVLERERIAAAAVSGTVGVERHRLVFEGQTSHAGTTPMELRRDAGLAAAMTELTVEQLAKREGGVGTTGAVRLEPGIPTAVPGRAELLVDLRHRDPEALVRMLAGALEAATAVAAERGCTVRSEHVWSIEPIAFDVRLVAAAEEAAGTGRTLASGALHDASEMARHLPTAMLFAPSTAGISHAKEEDTPEPDLERAIEAFGRLAERVIGGEVPLRASGPQV